MLSYIMKYTSLIQNLTDDSMQAFFKSVMYGVEILTPDEEILLKEKISENPNLDELNVLFALTPNKNLPNEYYRYHLKREEQYNIPFDYKALVTNADDITEALKYFIPFRAREVCNAFVTYNIKPKDELRGFIPRAFVVDNPGYLDWVLQNQLFDGSMYVDILELKKECQNIKDIEYLKFCNHTYGWTPDRIDLFLATILYQKKEEDYYLTIALNKHYPQDIAWNIKNIAEKLKDMNMPIASKTWEIIQVQKDLGFPFEWEDLWADKPSPLQETSISF